MHSPLGIIFFEQLSHIWQAQTFSWADLAIVALLVVLEGVLSVDNALVLGILVRPLAPDQRKRALTYGLVGAIVLRLIVIVAAAWLMRWHFVNLLGGIYLVYLAVKHFWTNRHRQDSTAPDTIPTRPVNFWRTVLVIELTDLAFAIDSILAAIAMVSQSTDRPSAKLSTHLGAHPKLWVVFVGGIFGVVLMRFAAMLFVKLLERFARMETAAYLLVFLVGAKLLAEYFFELAKLPPLDFRDPQGAAFWTFWLLMASGFLIGFLPAKPRTYPPHETH